MASYTHFKRFLKISLFIVFTAVSTLSHSETFEGSEPKPSDSFLPDSLKEKYSTWQVSDSPGMSFFDPTDVLNGSVSFEQLPETALMNTNGDKDVNNEIRLMVNFLKYNGIPMGLGANSNRDSFFDLYAPFVDILLDEPSARFGTTLESKVGKMHFFTHDSVHLYSGIPGPRLIDLKNKEESIERLAKVLMKKEALGSAWTALNHVRWFWNWRKTQETAENPKKATEDYEKYNKGLNSLSDMPREDFTSLIEAYMSGNFTEMVALYNKYADYETYRKARDAGVPMLFPDFSKKVGRHIEKLIVRYGLPIILPLVNMFQPKFGYFTLMKFSRSLAGFYYTDWYVEWADRFKVGEPLSEMEQNLERKVTDFKNNNFMREVPQAQDGIFEAMFVRNAIVQYGRKLIELKHLEKNRNASGRKVLTEKDLAVIDRLLQEAEIFSNEIIGLRQQNKALSNEQVMALNLKAKNIFAKTEQALPVDRVIPQVDRLDFANYSKFWQDSFAVVMDRPNGLTKFLSARSIWRESLRQEKEKSIAQAKHKKYKSVDMEMEPIIVRDLEKQLAAEYNTKRKGELAPTTQQETPEHLNRIENYRIAFNVQIQNVFQAQLTEFGEIPKETKEALFSATENFRLQINQLLSEYKELYTRRFINFEKSIDLKTKSIVFEENIKASVENVFYDLSDILNIGKTAKGNDLKKDLQAIAEKIEATTLSLKKGKVNSDGVERALAKVAPMKKGRFRLLCSAIARLCTNINVSDFVDTLKVKDFARQSKGIKVVLQSIDGKSVSIDNLPKNAAFVIAMNHDHGAIDAMAIKKIAKMLGVKHSSLLINKALWPQITAFEKMGNYYQDNKILFHDDKNLKKKVMDSLSAHETSRVSFSLFPEGQLPFWNNQFPLHTEWGAFNYARSAAHLLADVRPVYYVEVISNFMEAMTSENRIPLETRITLIEEVPKTPVGERDAWVEKRRQEFEDNANLVKKPKMTDLIANKKIPGTDILMANEVRRYVTVPEFFKEKVLSNKRNYPSTSCEAVFLEK